MGVRGRWAVLRAAGPQRGATTSLGMAIVIPVLLLATFGAITYAQWSYAGNLAQGAAQRGVEQARLSPASADRGATEALELVVVVPILLILLVLGVAGGNVVRSNGGVDAAATSRSRVRLR